MGMVPIFTVPKSSAWWPSDSDRDLFWSLYSSASHQRAFGWFNDDQWQWFGPHLLEILHSWDGCFFSPMPPQAEAPVARAGQLKPTPPRLPRLPQQPRPQLQQPQPARTARTARQAWLAQPQPVPQNLQQTARCYPPPRKPLIHQRREMTQPKEPASGAYWLFGSNESSNRKFVSLWLYVSMGEDFFKSKSGTLKSIRFRSLTHRKLYSLVPVPLSVLRCPEFCVAILRNEAVFSKISVSFFCRPSRVPCLLVMSMNTRGRFDLWSLGAGWPEITKQ